MVVSVFFVLFCGWVGMVVVVVILLLFNGWCNSLNNFVCCGECSVCWLWLCWFSLVSVLGGCWVRFIIRVFLSSYGCGWLSVWVVWLCYSSIWCSMVCCCGVYLVVLCMVCCGCVLFLWVLV